MEHEQMKEFCEVREAVYGGLRHGTFINRQHLLPICQYLVLPSFENPVSWDVIRIASSGSDEARLYRSCWRMDIDLQALSTPIERLKHRRPFVPAVEVGFAPIDLSQIEKLLAQFRNVRVSLAVTNPSVGCDGESYELTIGGAFCHARIAWWDQLPNEWRGLAPAIAELSSLFESTQVTIEPSRGGGQ